MRKATPRGGREPAVNANDLTRPGRRSDRDKTRTPVHRSTKCCAPCPINDSLTWNNPPEQSSRAIRAHKPHKGSWPPHCCKFNYQSVIKRSRHLAPFVFVPFLFLYYYFSLSLSILSLYRSIPEILENIFGSNIISRCVMKSKVTIIRFDSIGCRVITWKITRKELEF